MKFSNILKGTRAEKRIPVPGLQMPDGSPFVVLVRPLTGLEHEAAHASARARAIDKGVEKPELGDPIYDLALMAFILAVGCVDPDSSPEARTYSFASGEEILTEMHPEQIVYLHEHHDTWQHECSPSHKRISEDNLLEIVREVAADDGQLNFMRLSPSTRVSFATFTARMLLPSLEAKYSLGSTSESTGQTSNDSEK